MNITKKTYRNLIFLIGLLMMIVPICKYHFVLDNDIWFVLNHGRYIVNNGFPVRDFISIHSDFDFSIQKWLLCVLCYGLYCAFGCTGILVMFFFLYAIIQITMFFLCMYVSDKNIVASVIGTFTSMLILMSKAASTRPQAFTYLFVLLTVFCLEKYVREHQTKALVVIPFISLLWMQIHSTQWLFIIALFMPYLFDIDLSKVPVINRFTKESYKKLPIIIVFIVSLLTGIINPYGIDSLIYNIDSVKDLSWSRGIIECGTLSDFEWMLYIPFSAIILIAFYFNKKLPLRYAYFFIGTALFGTTRRNFPYFVLVCSFIIAYSLKDYQLFSIKNFKKNNHVIIPIAIFMMILFFVDLHDLNTSVFERTECKAVIDSFAENYGCPGARMYTDFDDGSYAGWKGYKVYIDPRAEVYIKNVNHTDDVYSEYNNFCDGKISFEELQAKYHFEYALIKRGTNFGNQINTYLENGTFELLVNDDKYAIVKIN